MSDNKPIQLNVENLNTKLDQSVQGVPSTNKPTVYIPNKSGHDFSDSLRYGKPQYITTGLVNRFSVMHMARKWFGLLKQSKQEDYILLTSLTILTVIGAAIFGHLHGRINLLIFRNNRYIARTIIFDQL